MRDHQHHHAAPAPDLGARKDVAAKPIDCACCADNCPARAAEMEADKRLRL
ncbi:MAG: hypothetical protein Q8L35_07465 [Actinomycetota bacterium]|nr:hypothetical protein [Actinomycetota bacterium]